MAMRPGIDSPSTAEGVRLRMPVDARLAKLRSQLQECQQSHGGECNRQGTDAGEACEIILIDVNAMRLDWATTAERYLSLSYVWGGINQFHATKATISELMEDGALRRHHDEIPTIIVQSMELARGLKVQFLWVDALCIIQDDISHKFSQISQMASIYSQSFLTIVAAEAKDATAHILALKPYPKIDSRPTFLGTRSQCQKLVKRLLQSTYGSRGWTFQERLLSRTILYDFQHHMLLQCPSGLWLMDSVTRWQKVQGHSESFKKLSPLVGSATRPDFEPFFKSEWLDETAFATYASIATEYTTKQLTYESDILLAFSGIAEGLNQRHPRLSFLHGLPERFLDYALLWHPGTLARRRKVDEIPSWSWMAWIGPVGFSYRPQSSNLLWILRPCIGPVEIWDQSGKRLIQRRPSRSEPRSLAPCTSSDSCSSDIPWPQAGIGPVLHFRAWCLSFQGTFTYEDADFSPHDTLRKLGERKSCPGLKLRSGKGQNVGWIMGLCCKMLNKYDASASRLEMLLVSECSNWTAFQATGYYPLFTGERTVLNFLLVETRPGRIFSERLGIGQVLDDEICKERRPCQREVYLS